MDLQGAGTINAGRVIYLKADGEIEFSVDRGLMVTGSHDSTVRVMGDGDRLRFSGNPTKFFQGHNLYGGNCLYRIFPRWAGDICERLNVVPAAGDRANWGAGNVHLTRVDLTRMYRPPFARPGWVPKWLAIASGVAHGGRQRTSNRGMYDANTLYVGANSRRISLKMYDKASEMRRHPPKIGEGNSLPALEAFAADTLRLEVELKSLELKDRKLRALKAWSPAVGDAILDERVGKLELNDRLVMSSDELEGLPRRLVLAYHAWRAGTDLRLLYSQRTFYRLRAELKEFGIDVSNVQPKSDEPTAARPMGRALRSYLTGELSPPAGDVCWELIAA